jgi:two-component system sensor histidine kinase CpxA
VHADEPVVFPGDARLVDSAIDNVVRNAVRHTAAGTAVDITLEPTPGAVLVHVRDHGPGVPADELERIFTPFYRVDRGRARDSGGVGLGLAIARRALRVHGGTVTAANAPGGGLVVTLRFPAAVTPSPHVADSSLREPDQS